MNEEQRSLKVLDINKVNFGLLRKLLKKQVFLEALGLIAPRDFLGDTVEYNHHAYEEEQSLMSKKNSKKLIFEKLRIWSFLRF